MLITWAHIEACIVRYHERLSPVLSIPWAHRACLVLCSAEFQAAWPSFPTFLFLPPVTGYIIVAQQLAWLLCSCETIGAPVHRERAQFLGGLEEALEPLGWFVSIDSEKEPSYFMIDVLRVLCEAYLDHVWAEHLRAHELQESVVMRLQLDRVPTPTWVRLWWNPFGKDRSFGTSHRMMNILMDARPSTRHVFHGTALANAPPLWVLRYPCGSKRRDRVFRRYAAARAMLLTRHTRGGCTIPKVMIEGQSVFTSYAQARAIHVEYVFMKRWLLVHTAEKRRWMVLRKAYSPLASGCAMSLLPLEILEIIVKRCRFTTSAFSGPDGASIKWAIPDRLKAFNAAETDLWVST